MRVLAGDFCSEKLVFCDECDVPFEKVNLAISKNLEAAASTWHPKTIKEAACNIRVPMGGCDCTAVDTGHSEDVISLIKKNKNPPDLTMDFLLSQEFWYHANLDMTLVCLRILGAVFLPVQRSNPG
ncbi:hypothetical protein HNY73_010064 [Argiope bruennichi]|uniref:Uncharacterized protein n=1 Tax=Argiope bruennichi TaxID=94029 RepID=A0A8T0F4P6_ARGBR|nr:hypothetical protein HNY73_010064 [Argiope bruennichi]